MSTPFLGVKPFDVVCHMHKVKQCEFSWQCCLSCYPLWFGSPKTEGLPPLLSNTLRLSSESLSTCSETWGSPYNSVQAVIADVSSNVGLHCCIQKTVSLESYAASGSYNPFIPSSRMISEPWKGEGCWIVICQLDTSWSHLRGGGLNWENASMRWGCSLACRIFS